MFILYTHIVTNYISYVNIFRLFLTSIIFYKTNYTCNRIREGDIMSSDEIDIKIPTRQRFIKNRITELRLKMGVSEYQMSLI